MMRSPRVGGGSMLRAASRFVSGKETFSSATGSSTGSGGSDVRTVSVPAPPPPAVVTSPTFASGATVWSDWETVSPEVQREEGDAEEELELEELWLFERAPSSDEVQTALWSLQQMPIPSAFPQERNDEGNSNSDTADEELVSMPIESRSGEISAEPESDWIEPTFHARSEISSSANNHRKALEAFHLLKVNPSIQRMVVSLSSDKAVWDAVMKNEAVQEIKKSLCEGISEAKVTDNTGGPVDGVISALSRMFGNTKDAMMDLVEKVKIFVNNLVQPSEKKVDETSFFPDAVKSSLMLSVFVFLIVIAGRLQK